MDGLGTWLGDNLKHIQANIRNGNTRKENPSTILFYIESSIYYIVDTTMLSVQ